MKRKKINKIFGFTFVELVVSIAISMILMFSVTLFVENGIKNITNQDSVFGNYLQIKEFTNDVYDNFSYINKSYTPINLSSGVLLKINKDFDKGGFLYIGKGSFDKLYCSAGSDNEITDHIYLKNFIPFEGFSGDLFAGANFDSGGIKTNMFLGTINGFTGILDGPSGVAFGSGNMTYVSDTLNHAVYSFDKTNIHATVKMIAGEGMFGDDFYDGLSGTGVLLNSPTGLSYSTIGGTGYLFISDTLNDRILYLDLSDNKIYKLLGRDDGISEPTGIYYDDGNKTLYIANSGKKDILSYSSSGSFKDNLTLNFTEEDPITNIDKVEVSFLYDSGITNPSVLTPTETGSFTFSPDKSGQDFLERKDNSLIYHFLNYNGSTISEANCVSAGTYLLSTSGQPIHCTGVGTGVLSTTNSKTFSGSNQISINGIGHSSNFGNDGSYYVELGLFSGNLEKSFHYFSYFVNSDNDIFTKDDNIMKVLTGSLGYPTGIYPDGDNLVFNDFWTRKSYEIDKNGNTVSFKNLNAFDFSKVNTNQYTDNILSAPIKDYYIKYNTTFNILDFYFDYYDNYSCYSNNSSGALSEFVMKKSYK